MRITVQDYWEILKSQTQEKQMLNLNLKGPYPST